MLLTDFWKTNKQCMENTKWPQFYKCESCIFTFKESLIQFLDLFYWFIPLDFGCCCLIFCQVMFCILSVLLQLDEWKYNFKDHLFSLTLWWKQIKIKNTKAQHEKFHSIYVQDIYTFTPWHNIGIFGWFLKTMSLRSTGNIFQQWRLQRLCSHCLAGTLLRCH